MIAINCVQVRCHSQYCTWKWSGRKCKRERICSRGFPYDYCILWCTTKDSMWRTCLLELFFLFLLLLLKLRSHLAVLCDNNNKQIETATKKCVVFVSHLCNVSQSMIALNWSDCIQRANSSSITTICCCCCFCCFYCDGYATHFFFLNTIHSTIISLSLINNWLAMNKYNVMHSPEQCESNQIHISHVIHY